MMGWLVEDRRSVEGWVSGTGFFFGGVEGLFGDSGWGVWVFEIWVVNCNLG